MAKRQDIPDILGPARQQVSVLDDVLSGKPVTAAETSMIRSQLRYDYSQIPADQRETVQAAAVEIVRNGRQAQDSLIQVGKQLMAVKDMLEHGQFEDWCETEFQMSPRTVQNMMNVARTFEGKSEKFALLGDSTLYMLAAPSTPEAAREQVIAEAEATGSRPSVARVKEVIAQHKPTMTQLAEMIETRPNLKSTDLRAAARKRAGHWLYDTAASNAEATWPGAWNQTTLVNALHYVADALDRAASTPTVQPVIVTRIEPSEPTVSLDELEVVDSVTVRVDDGGKLMMDWDDDDWAAYQRKLNQRQAANVVPSEATGSRQQGAELAKCSVCHRPLSDPASAIAGVGPCCAAKRTTAAGSGDAALDVLAPDRNEPTSAAQKRNERIESVLRRLYAAQAAASEFEELTGVYTHTPAFRRVMENMISVLEANRI